MVRELDEASVSRALKALAAKGVEAITVSLINSFANDAHEKRIREIAEKELPSIPISLSCDILPRCSEYERALTTVANSYVRPTVSKSRQPRRRMQEQWRQCAVARAALGRRADGVRQRQARAGETC